MKKLIAFLPLTCSLSVLFCSAQNPTYQQKLYWTCKLWGFVKYFHSNVSVCGVNWDSVLIADLPLVKNAVTKNDFNNALDTILKAAGPMALTNSPPCDTVPPELSRNLNFSWLNDTIFRNDVFAILDTIKNNFRPHSECSVEINPNQADGGYLKFQSGDSLILNINDYYNYPDEWHRLLELFVHWNIINYFNPYNYLQNQPWDSTLYQNIINIDTASNDASFYTSFIKISSNMEDAHVQGFTSDVYSKAPLHGWYSPRNLVLKYIPGKYIVAKSSVPGLTIGDQIISVNGLTTKQWEDSLKPYLSFGDSGAFQEEMEEFMILSADYSSMTLTYLDSLNNIQATTALCNDILPFELYYPNDTLANIQWRNWGNCNVGYINVGKMLDAGSDVSNCYSSLVNTNAIIFDIRNYPASSAVFDFCNNYLFPYSGTPCVDFMGPNVNYPGTFYWFYSYNSPGSLNPYQGKVIILFNETTISAAEFASMVLSEFTNSVKIGSQTDGTDGNITYYNLTQYMTTGFTSLGVFYPNGDSTERIGIKPDILMYPTQAGIRAGRDELLEKALEVAGCPLSVSVIQKENPLTSLYPDPNNGQFIIRFNNTEKNLKSLVKIEVYNVLGLRVFNKVYKLDQVIVPVNMENQPSGIYFYKIIDKMNNTIEQGKFVVL